MPSVTFIEADGTEHVIELSVGTSLMQGAVTNLVPGIEGDCGGLCACATCHIYVSDEWWGDCGEPDELEKNILEFAYNADRRSRLACQIDMKEELSEMILQLPKRQY